MSYKPGGCTLTNRHPCTPCSGTGQVPSHNPKCWDCTGVGYRVNGVKWRCPNLPVSQVRAAFALWQHDGTLTDDQGVAHPVTPAPCETKEPDWPSALNDPGLR